MRIHLRKQWKSRFLFLQVGIRLLFGLKWFLDRFNLDPIADIILPDGAMGISNIELPLPVFHAVGSDVRMGLGVQNVLDDLLQFPILRIIDSDV